jgi:hypothetical protein
MSTQRYRANYRLGTDFDSEIRNALTVLFEIDPASNRTAKVEATINWKSSMGSNFWCQHWITATRVSLRILIEGNQQNAQEGSFDATVDETFCAALGLFPGSDAVGSNIDEALHLAFEKAVVGIKNLADGTGTATTPGDAAFKSVKATKLFRPARKIPIRIVAITGPRRERFYKLGDENCKLEIEIRETSQDLIRKMLNDTFEGAEMVESTGQVKAGAPVIDIFLETFQAKGKCKSGLCDIEVSAGFEYRPDGNAGVEKVTEKTETQVSAKNCIDTQYRFDQATERTFIRGVNTIQQKLINRFGGKTS